jgi:hypothetical protein
MNQETKHQNWQQLEDYLYQLVGRFLKEDYPSIEYKPRHIALLPMPAGYNIDRMEDAA